MILMPDEVYTLAEKEFKNVTEEDFNSLIDTIAFLASELQKAEGKVKI